MLHTNWESEKMSVYLCNTIVQMSKSQYLNYLAIQILEVMGNENPLQAEIDEVEAYLNKFCSRKIKQKRI